MYVRKRNGELEKASLDPILERIDSLRLKEPELTKVISIEVAKKVVMGLVDGIETKVLDDLAVETCIAMSSLEDEYGKLASRIIVSNLHKCTSGNLKEVAYKMIHNINERNGKEAPLITLKTYVIMCIEELQKVIDYERDYNLDFFGFKTLAKSYLSKVNGEIVDRPQIMWMRVAIGIHGFDIDSVIETYNLLSQGLFTHATPTLFHSGTPKPQMSSCFLLQINEDSIEGIYDALKNCALISKTAGGIGLSIHRIRSSGSYIRGSKGISNGLVPMLRVFNDTARYVDQGGGIRKGAFAIYLEPWHADVMDFLDLKKNSGKEEMRARDLFYALWIPDLFMERVEKDEDWSLFCPDEAPGLFNVYGEEFNELYMKYEKQGIAKSVIKAESLWRKICDNQVETGIPYILFKDACNRKSNQKNLGTIQSSNLCTEIIQYTSPEEIAVCNLASISLPSFIEDGKFLFSSLIMVTRVIVRNLDKIIDLNYYPVKEAQISNFKHRAIGVGVQGLADVFLLLGYSWDSEEARELNKEIFETIYYACVSESCILAKKKGAYSTFEGSPASLGLLQFDLWECSDKLSKRLNYDWETLKMDVKKYGLRNSLLTTVMPTGSTSQILGNTECIEPYARNIYIRRTLAGEFTVVNKHLIRELKEMGLWNSKIKDSIILARGSIQHISEIPKKMKKKYETAFEIKQKILIDMAADRGIFIDQSQSLNLSLSHPTYDTLCSMHFYSWKKGLKTGSYYLRTDAATHAITFSVDHSLKVHYEKEMEKKEEEEDKISCIPECESCDSVFLI